MAHLPIADGSDMARREVEPRSWRASTFDLRARHGYPDRNAKRSARRRARKLVTAKDVSAEIAVIYEKPIEEWDDEELTRGRPRSSDGTFRGSRPKWLTPALQAERQRRLRQLMSNELGTFAADALRVIHAVVMDDRRDDDGKLVVPASVRVDAAKYLVDQFIHRLSKGTRRALASLPTAAEGRQPTR
jgi:hypothetical protein